MIIGNLRSISQQIVDLEPIIKGKPVVVIFSKNPNHIDSIRKDKSNRWFRGEGNKSVDPASLLRNVMVAKVMTIEELYDADDVTPEDGADNENLEVDLGVYED